MHAPLITAWGQQVRTGDDIVTVLMPVVALLTSSPIQLSGDKGSPDMDCLVDCRVVAPWSGETHCCLRVRKLQRETAIFADLVRADQIHR